MTRVWPVWRSEAVVCSADAEGATWLPGAEPVLPHPLLLQKTRVLQFNRAGNEAHLAAFLHQTPDPPVIVVLLLAEQTDSSQKKAKMGACAVLHVLLPTPTLQILIVTKISNLVLRNLFYVVLTSLCFTLFQVFLKINTVENFWFH